MNIVLKTLYILLLMIGSGSYGMKDGQHQLNALGQQLSGAAEDGNVQRVQALLDRQAPVNYRDSGGRIPLHWAARNGHDVAVQLLIQYGATIDQANNRGENPLHLAARWSRQSTRELMVDRMLIQNESVRTFLLCLKRTFDRGTDVALRQVLTPWLCQLIIPVNEEIQKIKNREIKQQLLEYVCTRK